MRKFRDHPGLSGAALFDFTAAVGAAEEVGEATAGAGAAGVGAAGESLESARLSPAREEDGAAAGVAEEAIEDPKADREVDLTAGEEGAGEALGAEAVGVETAAGAGAVAGAGGAAVVVEVG